MQLMEWTALAKLVMPGLVPGIHVLQRQQQERRGWPGHRRAEATPFFERLCPAMTKERINFSPQDGLSARETHRLASRAWGRDGCRGVYHRARIRATRWLHPCYGLLGYAGSPLFDRICAAPPTARRKASSNWQPRDAPRGDRP